MEQAKGTSKAIQFSTRGGVLLAVALLLLGWLLNTPPGLLGKADAIGYAVCHRIDLRSFHLGERQIPLCARCSGMFLGALLGIAYLSSFSARRANMPHWQVLVLLGAFAGAFALDGVNSYLQLFPNAPALYQPQNWLRLLTGSGMGLALAGILFPAFNQTVWSDPEPQPVLTLRSLAPLVLLAFILDALVLTENPLILYPLALLSALGVVTLLTMVYTMMWLIITRSENRYQRWADIALPLISGFGMALLQIAILDLVRFAFTGTWDGFHFG